MNNDFPDVLLVEDNPRDAELTIRALKRRKLANQLIHVEDGEEALDFLFARGRHAGRSDQGKPRLVLLDLKLPKVDGLGVLRAMRADPRTRHTPVVILTSSEEDRDVVEGYQLGVNSYIVKPVEFEAFSEAVARLGSYWLLMNKVSSFGTGKMRLFHE